MFSIHRSSESKDGGVRKLLTSGLITACVLSMLVGGSVASLGQQVPPPKPAPPPAPADPNFDASAKAFREARDLIANEEWVKAADSFNRFIDSHSRSSHADAALYWLAFSLNKQEKFDVAEQTLTRLLKEFPASAWADDAKSLQVEMAVRQGRHDAVLEAVHTSSSEEARIVALQSVARENPERAVVLLADVLKSGSSASKHLREVAVNLLGRIGGAQSSAMLADIARTETDVEIRKIAIYSLGQSTRRGDLDLLEELARGSAGSEVSEAAIVAISHNKSERALGLLSELAQTTQEPKVRSRIIHMLGVTGGDKSADELMKIFNATRNPNVQQQVITAFFQHGGEAATGKLLAIARQGSTAEVRKQAISWVSRRGDEPAIEGLAQLYDVEQNEEIKESILVSLGQSRQKSALAKLMRVAASDASAVLRQKAVLWLKLSKDPEAMRFIKSLPQ